MKPSILGNYFEDFETGAIIEHSLSKTIFESANNIFSMMTMNHHPVHTNLDYAEQNIILAKNLGFEGMLVLNPKELPLVHQYYSPSEQEVEDAKEMLRLYDEAQKEGKGVALMNGKFIGPPMVIMAKKTLHRHKLAGSKKQV